MASEHDLDLVARISAGDASGLLLADDPAEVAAAAAPVDGVVRVDVEDLAAAIAAARVGLAERVVARARRAEQELVAGVTAPSDPGTGGDGPAHHADADRHAIRFSVAILVPALAGGIAVYLADGLLLAPALPAVGLALVVGVVLAHRRGAAPPPSAALAPEHADPGAVVVGDGPAVRAAEAHLRRQQAGWKLAWWERGQPVPDLPAWSAGRATDPAITLVSVDVAGSLDADAHAAMTAATPAPVRVAVLQPRS
ncbi:hypothetical protein NHL50_12580 [Acidimicrobiia bacterium EGI L10123]|uniref:hypothetical protein n=1 Tax=Salinilacustrithrix flava TaxID=2957203 RepID=UPI003D7C1C68|nr:hypothetical protein [Acidimicrobiia bacterium EGI L10123]